MNSESGVRESAAKNGIGGLLKWFVAIFLACVILIAIIITVVVDGANKSRNDEGSFRGNRSQPYIDDKTPIKTTESKEAKSENGNVVIDKGIFSEKNISLIFFSWNKLNF